MSCLRPPVSVPRRASRRFPVRALPPGHGLWPLPAWTGLDGLGWTGHDWTESVTGLDMLVWTWLSRECSIGAAEGVVGLWTAESWRRIPGRRGCMDRRGLDKAGLDQLDETGRTGLTGDVVVLLYGITQLKRPQGQARVTAGGPPESA